VPELRIDPLTGEKTIVAAERERRPGGLGEVDPPPPIDPATDPFAEGNEDRTPPEVYALRPNGTKPNGPGWQVRVVPNLFPALAGGPHGAELAEWEGERRRRAAGPLAAHNLRLELFSAHPAYGAHEVIVNTPRPVSTLAELTAEELERAFSVWQQRFEHHRDAAYVQLIVNERREAGASLPHSHAQLFALPFVPAEVARERERYFAYAQRSGGENLMADLVAEELRLGERVVLVGDQAVLLAPYASRLPFEVMVVPRRPAPRFEEAPAEAANLLGEAVRRLAACFGASPPLNLYLRTAPAGAEQFSWRIAVAPRIGQIAGLELSTGLYLNPVAPEEAARRLRAADGA